MVIPKRNLDAYEQSLLDETLQYFDVAHEHDLKTVRYFSPWDEQFKTGFFTWRDAYQHMLREEAWWSFDEI